MASREASRHAYGRREVVAIITSYSTLQTAISDYLARSDLSTWLPNFTQNWDPKYETVLSSNDPGEPEKEGGELFTRYGKGVFVYTSYSWFRQLPAGVPGAYKLFANLVSAK